MELSGTGLYCPLVLTRREKGDVFVISVPGPLPVGLVRKFRESSPTRPPTLRGSRSGQRQFRYIKVVSGFSRYRLGPKL